MNLAVAREHVVQPSVPELGFQSVAQVILDRQASFIRRACQP
ncbi:MAG: hypothetical protein ACXW3Z_16600 [Limisphaerales bacterium]